MREQKITTAAGPCHKEIFLIAPAPNDIKLKAYCNQHN